MPGKDELVALLDRSATVVEVELRLLDRWKSDPATTAGRQAQIEVVERYIGVGFSCALRRTAFVLNEAKTLGDAVHPPSSQHETAVDQTVQSIAQRLTWPGPELSDASFDNAMLLARSNSDQAAENSESIFSDCAGQAGGPPQGVVAAAPELLAALGEEEKKPSRKRPKA